MPVRDLWMTKATATEPARRTSRYGNGRRWQAVWYVDGREATKSFARKLDAERHLAVTITSQLRGDYADPRSGRVTVRAYAEDWLARQLHLRPGSRALYTSHLRRHIFPKLGSLPMGDVRKTTVQGFAAGLVAADLAPQTVRAIMRTASLVFNAAVADQVIARNPAAGVKLPERARSRAVALTVEQVYALAEHMPRQYRAVVLLGAGSGLRPGELLGLEVDPGRGVDMLGRRVLVRQQLRSAAGPAVLGPPKSSASVRDVPLADETVQVLAEHLAEFPPAEVRLEDRTGARPVKRTARLLFATSQPRSGRRGPVGRAGFSQAWNRAVVRARAAGVVLPERVTPHSLRHTYVSLMIAEGAGPKTIQALVGHEKISITYDTYGHLFPDEHETATRAAIGAALRRDENERGLRSVK